MQGMTFKEIGELPREELISLFDHENKNVQHGLNFIKEEIWRKDSDVFNKGMESIAQKMWWATAVIGVLTVVNLDFIIYSAVK